MAKGHTFHLQRYFLMFGAFFSVAALGIIVYASQKPTNTSSHAAALCTTATPIFYTKKYLLTGPANSINNLETYRIVVYINNYCKTPKTWYFSAITFGKNGYLKNAKYRILPDGKPNIETPIKLDGLQRRPLVVEILTPVKFDNIDIVARLSSDSNIFWDIHIWPWGTPLVDIPLRYGM